MTHPLVLVLARVLIASVFIVLGAERLLGAAGMGPLAGTSLSNGVLLLSLFELIAGTLIVVGWQVRALALVMAAVLLVDAVLAHPFWRFSGASQHAQLLHFFKNLATIGGLLLLAALGRRTR
ncbi:DoxX family membrane protein [Dokdonella sp. MW10]|uniref:DoxX family membrane protein n=1 Tax=Dokdonella sp. MW10 TaxID=2992926 RepID=UPI003F7D1C0A